MQQPAEREIVLIPIDVIREMKISQDELQATMYKTWLCELGQPEAPNLNDWRAQRVLDEDTRERMRRFERVNVPEVVAGVISTRIDVAGNLVGNVTPNYEHPKAKAFEKALMKPKHGVSVYPRFKLKHLYMNTYTVKIIGFDMGFK
jgi:hypothetical protein